VRLPAQRVLDATTEVLDEATEYLAERRRTMIFAVRDRLRAEQRHLVSTRAGLVTHSRHLTDLERAPAGESPGAPQRLRPEAAPRAGLVDCDHATGAVVTSLDDVAVGDVVSVLVSDGSFESTVSEKRESTP
jgi:exonuclease VII large subunit